MTEVLPESTQDSCPELETPSHDVGEQTEEHNGRPKSTKKAKARHGKESQEQEKHPRKKKKQHSNLLPKKHVSIEGDEKRKTHRWRPGTLALRQIRHLQKSVKHQIPREAMKRVVREIVANENPKFRMKRRALDSLHAMVENYVVGVFESAQIFAEHSNRLGVHLKDYDLAVRFRPESQLIGSF